MKKTGFSIFLVVCATGYCVAFKGPSPQYDWHNVTVEGFSAGVTRAQLEARLGPPSRGDNIWSQKNHSLRLFESSDGYHNLEGNEIEIGKQVLAKGDLELTVNKDPVTGKQIQYLFGPGHILKDKDQENEFELDYKDSLNEKANRRGLRITFVSTSDSSAPLYYKPVQSFSLIWK